jgi:hypothetical protein
VSRAPASEVLRQLLLTDLPCHCSDIIMNDSVSLRFTLNETGRAALELDPRFASGVLHGLHADVGAHRDDYRSYSGAFGKGSLQIVVDRVTGAAYADVDGHNPYQDVVGFVGHAFAEVVPGWIKKRFRKGDA